MTLNLPEQRDNAAVRSLLDGFKATSEVGQLLRQSLAKRCLDNMVAIEADLMREQQHAAEIENRIARMEAEHSLRMQYLMRFGVTPEERHEFQRLLKESTQHGGLSPREAAALAHRRHRFETDQRNGSSTGMDSALATPPSVVV